MADTESEFMTPAQVAARFNVDTKTVSRWAKAGKLSYVTTLGGHRRYRRVQIEALMKEKK